MGGNWDWSKLNELLPEQIKDNIRQLPVTNNMTEDRMVWEENLDARYKICRSYNFLNNDVILN